MITVACASETLGIYIYIEYSSCGYILNTNLFQVLYVYLVFFQTRFIGHVSFLNLYL